MKRLILTAVLFLSWLLFSQSGPLTRAERTEYRQTSLYDDVLDFLFQVAADSRHISLLPLTRSAEGRMIPLVVLSREGIAHFKELPSTGKPAVLIMANIHAGEVEGKEASLMLIREVASGRLVNLLDNQSLLLLPLFNADGNDKLGRNRRDDGPELAGVRHNGQFLDLNRDYLKLESPEINALLTLFNTWDPFLVIDLHTTNGSYHREPVTYTTMAHPNTSDRLRRYMWDEFFPAVGRTLKKRFGFDSIPYGNFVDREDPGQGWINDAIEARYGSNYVGLRNRFSILDENYSYADFKTRVNAAFGFLVSILEHTNRHGREMAALAARADDETARAFADQKLALDFKIESLFPMTVKSFGFFKEPIPAAERSEHPPWVGDFLIKKTSELKDYRLPYLGLAVPQRTLALPQGYILLPFQDDVLKNLRAHGIRVARLVSGVTLEAENYVIEKIEVADTLFQGRALNRFQGTYQRHPVDFPANSWFVTMHQPLARLVTVLLEPESPDSLAAWGFFNRLIVTQWTNKPARYPVFRVFKRPAVAMIQE